MAAEQRGFTLLELLVALALAAVVLIASGTMLIGLNRAHERATDQMERQRALRNTIDLLRRELSSTLFRPGDKQLRFQVLDRDIFGKQASAIRLTTLAPPLAGNTSDQLSVLYQAEEQYSWIRLSRASHDYFLHESFRAVPYPMLDRLNGFLVECNDGTRWLRHWDTELTGRLPKEIRVTILVANGSTTDRFVLTAAPKMDGP